MFVNINFNLIIKWYDIVVGIHICLSNTKDRETLGFQRLKDKQCSRFTLQDYTLEGRRTPKVEQHRGRSTIADYTLVKSRSNNTGASRLK